MWKVSEYDVQTLTSFKLNFHVSRFKYNFSVGNMECIQFKPFLIFINTSI